MIYLDVTETVLCWAGSPTGIQRVVLSLARAAGARRDVLPVLRFVDLSDRFRGWRWLRPDSIDTLVALDPRASGRLSMERLRKAAVRVGNAVANGPLNAVAPGQVWRWKEARRRILGGDQFSLRSARAFERSEPVDFRDGDALVVVDSQWNSPYSWYEIEEVQRRRPGLRVTSLVYDLTPVMHPHLFDPPEIRKFEDYLVETVIRSDGILAISEASLESYRVYLRDRKKDAAGYSPFATIRLADDLGPRSPTKTEVNLDNLTATDKELNHRLPESVKDATRWLLWVGSLHPKKNLDVVLMAMRRLWNDEGMAMPLVVAGKEHSYNKRLGYMLRTDPGFNGRLVFLGDVTDETLEMLYRQAHCLIQSSWSEGFGLTVGEALQRGCPCVVSRVESLPEVGGDLVDYFDPWRPDQLADRVARLVNDREYYELRKRNTAQFVPTTWGQTLDQLVESVNVAQRGVPTTA
jgi:glycosyltransferase involved in cell wall biosynthesis